MQQYHANQSCHLEVLEHISAIMNHSGVKASVSITVVIIIHHKSCYLLIKQPFPIYDLSKK